MLQILGHLGNRTLLTTINGYQRHLSPIKGFKCAAGQLYGDSTCSAVVKQIVQTQGFIQGLPAIQQQIKRCHHAARQIKTDAASSAQTQPQVGAFCCILPIPL
ncbi:MAG: membrane protein insertion efficiency factor YidD [Moraxellaceae bacterium]|nr:MAG: membrane protein insertion efficiency factor YidD [Moraxellaceae bacterium]